MIVYHGSTEIIKTRCSTFKEVFRHKNSTPVFYLEWD